MEKIYEGEKQLIVDGVQINLFEQTLIATKAGNYVLGLIDYIGEHDIHVSPEFGPTKVISLNEIQSVQNKSCTPSWFFA